MNNLSLLISRKLLNERRLHEVAGAEKRTRDLERLFCTHKFITQLSNRVKIRLLGQAGRVARITSRNCCCSKLSNRRDEEIFVDLQTVHLTPQGSL